MKIPQLLKCILLLIAIPVTAFIVVAVVYFFRYGQYVGGMH